MVFRVKEEFDIHYGEFSEPYGTLPRRNLVSQGVTNLNHAEGQSFPSVVQQTSELDENALCSFWTPVAYCVGIRSNSRGEHGQKILGFAEVSAAVRALNDAVLDFFS